MKKLLFIILIAFLVNGCEIEYGTGQWNLNKSLGWKSKNLLDYTTLFIKFSEENADSSVLVNKKKLNAAIAEELLKNGLGDPVEYDISKETEMHFVVSKDYERALKVILSIVDTIDLKQKVIIYQRDCKTYRNWVDIVIYPK